jgi:hypothetical protein
LNLFSAFRNRWLITKLCTQRGGLGYLASIVLEALSQIFQIFGIFVPLKVIYLLSSDDVPSYLLSIDPSLSLAFWVWLLTGITILLFVSSAALSACAEKLSRWCAQRYVAWLADHGKSMDKKGARRMQQIIRSNYKLSVDFFIPILFYSVLFFVDYWFFAIANAILSCVFFVFSLAAYFSRKRALFEKLWNERFETLVKYTFMLSFMVFFVALVFVVLGGYEAGFIKILASLVLTRRLLQLLERGIRRHRAALRKNDIQLLLN